MKQNRNQPSKSSNRTLIKSKGRPRQSDDTNETSRRYLPLPIEFTPESKFNFKRRFACGSALNFSLSIYHLLAMKLVATTTIVGNSLFSVVRLKRLQIWTPCITMGAGATCTITPLSFDSTDNNLNDVLRPISDSTSNTYEYAYVDFVPKKTHPSGMWHTSRAIDDALLSINATTGSIVDITLECIENTSGAPLGFTRVIAGATAGTIYTCRPATGMTAVAVNDMP